MDRLLSALLLVLGPSVALWRASRSADANAWRLLRDAAIGGSVSGVAVVILALAIDSNARGDVLGDVVGGIAMALPGGAGVAAIIGGIVLMIRAWLRAPAPPA